LSSMWPPRVAGKSKGIGGSFSFQKSGIPAGLLTECKGTVVGTQAVTFTALALVTRCYPTSAGA
jgi:hypothetical protein